MDIVVSFLLYILLHLFYLDSGTACLQNSSKFLLEMMTLVSSANIMGTDEVLVQKGGHLYRLWKAKALKLSTVQLHAVEL
jgi:hypothetical protein